MRSKLQMDHLAFLELRLSDYRQRAVDGKTLRVFPKVYLLLQDVIITSGKSGFVEFACTFVSLASGRQYYPVLGMLGSAQCRSTNQDKSALVLSMCCNMAISRCSNVRNANIADFEIKACRSGSGVNSGNFSSENFWIFLGSPKAFRSCRN